MTFSDTPERALQTNDLTGLTVLLVEDDVDCRDMFALVLERYGASVVTAGTAEEAIEIVERSEPDVLVSDVSLPNEDGMSLVRRVHARALGKGWEIPAVAISGWVTSGDREDALAAGFHEFLEKPVSPHRLASAIAGLRERTEAVRSLRLRLRERRADLSEQRILLEHRRAQLKEAQSVLASQPTARMRTTAAPTDDGAAPFSTPKEARNRFLRSIPHEDYPDLVDALEPVELQVGQTLRAAGDVATWVYFPETTVVSLSAVASDGQAVDLMAIGCDGMVCGVKDEENAEPHQALVLKSGRAWRLPIAIFERECARTGPLQSLVNGYIRSLFVSAGQAAVCARYHSLEGRLCRWLLSLSDCGESNVIEVSHAQIARAIGVRRAGVTVDLGALEELHAIQCRRKSISIVDRAALEARACACYRRPAEGTD